MMLTHVQQSEHLLLFPGFIIGLFDDNEDTHLGEIRHFKFSYAQYCNCGLLLLIFQICSFFRIISSAFAINPHS